jgi:hypothetical protein
LSTLSGLIDHYNSYVEADFFTVQILSLLLYYYLPQEKHIKKTTRLYKRSLGNNVIIIEESSVFFFFLLNCINHHHKTLGSDWITKSPILHIVEKFVVDTKTEESKLTKEGLTPITEALCVM